MICIYIFKEKPKDLFYRSCKKKIIHSNHKILVIHVQKMYEIPICSTDGIPHLIYCYTHKRFAYNKLCVFDFDTFVYVFCIFEVFNKYYSLVVSTSKFNMRNIVI